MLILINPQSKILFGRVVFRQEPGGAFTFQARSNIFTTFGSLVYKNDWVEPMLSAGD
jgi:hypothetical protein